MYEVNAIILASNCISQVITVLGKPLWRMVAGRFGDVQQPVVCIFNFYLLRHNTILWLRNQVGIFQPPEKAVFSCSFSFVSFDFCTYDNISTLISQAAKLLNL